ncbi:DUF3141 domain-containing protein [Chitinilyticum piscinae]|uniref:DUF3141 domain-containing protein n=1 Tax=Chitinilyticum piscinae TaxID=2866724 RepID=A0A8J7K0F5_9NEIS|nr:DUF3141 domain-containing protein [Chitinilyticum piscinae]MBE9607931.1 DUF3141 domain-containing protein [Chitinilyticum piscinae]
MWTNDRQLEQTVQLQGKVTRRVLKRSAAVTGKAIEELAPAAPAYHDPQALFESGLDYLRDTAERQLLFWDVLRQRGDQFLAHEAAGKPPVLHFAYEIVLDARSFARPANYALARIIPPAGSASVDPTRRPYVIIDPRAGHGPGIGGFKQDSEIGMALKDAHPVYAVIFFPRPEPGQTLADVTAAEEEFLRWVGREHPDAPKPVLVGNCQGGWAAMLVAAAAPELVGAVVVNGAPVSYWAGNDNNPMRYAGGILGGAWPALLASDLGNGLFDGAHLVANFENLNLGNTLVDKSYHLYDRVDTEPPRYLEFERWWGGPYLMNEEEIQWIVENLFIGNNLVEGKASARQGQYDLKAIHAPIVVFASLGDNITPPQQAFNWILDLYPTTDALKQAGQVVVGLVHESVGHLGIFVSAGVATKEHAKIVELMHVIETLAPGLYAMKITADPQAPGGWRAELTERRVEELQHAQQFDRQDEIPFSAVEAVSELTTRSYEMFLRPWVRAFTNETTAQAGRMLHPNRLQQWAWSSLNPVASALGAVAGEIRAHRQPAADDNPWRQWERDLAARLSASLNLLGDLRDVATEAAFFSTYGWLAMQGIGAENRQDTRQPDQAGQVDDAALAAQLDQGGAAAGLIRLGLLLTRDGDRIPLTRRQFTVNWLTRQPALAGLDDEALRQLIREQSLLVWRLPDAALASLPRLFDTQAALDDAFNTYAQLAELVPGEFTALDERLQALRAALGPATPAAASTRKAAAPRRAPAAKSTTAGKPATAPADKPARSSKRKPGTDA